MEGIEIKGMIQTQSGVRKWLLWLLIVNIISLSLGVLTKALNIGFMNDWLQIVCRICILFCLFQLRNEHKLYIAAIVFACLNLVCTLLHTFFLGDTGFRLLLKLHKENVNMVIAELGRFFMAVHLIGGLCASIFEYMGHARLAKPFNQRSCKYWIWLIIGTVLLFAVMRVVTWFFTDMLSKGTLDIQRYQRIYPFLNLPGRLLQIGYLACLFQTMQVLPFEVPDLALLDEGEIANRKKSKHIAWALLGIGIVLVFVSAVITVYSMRKINIVGGADWPTFRLFLANGVKGLYFTMMMVGFATILVSVIKGSGNNRIKAAAILILPFFLFLLLREPYDWLNGKLIVEWLGCGCPQKDAFGNYFTPKFNANHFNRLFWLLIAVCTTVVSFLASGKVLKNKKLLRALYVIGVFLVSLLIAHRYYRMMFWN